MDYLHERYEPGSRERLLRLIQEALGVGREDANHVCRHRMRSAQWLAHLAEAIRSGRYVALYGAPRASAPAPMGSPQVEDAGYGSEQPKPPPAAASTNDFVVRFVDEVGAAVSGLDVTFLAAGQAFDRVTSAAGVARLDGVSAVSATVAASSLATVRRVMGPRWNRPRGRAAIGGAAGAVVWELRSDTVPRFDLRPSKERVISIQPCVARARLIGGYFDVAKSFILPVGLAGLRGAVRLAHELGRAQLLIVGHTDPSGAPEYNDQLALERAEAVRDFLTDQVDGWLKWYSPFIAEQKRWGRREDIAMIAALPDAGERPPEQDSVTWFQWTRGLPADGKPNQETRRALISEYMALDGTSLPRDVRVVTHGCGESFPESAEAAEIRRVELYFFDHELGVQPPPPGPVSKPGSQAYPDWVLRAKRTEDYAAAIAEQKLRLRVLQGEHWAPTARERVVLEALDAGIAHEQALSQGMLDGDESVDVVFHGLPEGQTYRLRVEGVDVPYVLLDRLRLEQFGVEIDVSSGGSPRLPDDLYPAA